MNDAWEEVKKLEGKTIFTLAQQKPFVVERVLNDRIEYRPKSGSGAIRWSWRKDIEHLITLHQREGTLTPSRVAEEFPKEYNSSYMAAIVNVIVERT
jgi:hypothetical protein